MVIVSVYLFHTEGMTARNRSALQSAFAVARNYGSPWVIAGDFNETPAFIMHHWGAFLEEANAYVLAPSEATRQSRTGANRTLDFVVCSDSVEPWIDEIAVDHGFHAEQHRAVRIRLQDSPTN